MFQHLKQYGGTYGTHTHHFRDCKLVLTESDVHSIWQALLFQIGVVVRN